MSEPRVTGMTVGAAIGGSVQIIKFEYTEQYRVEKSFTYEGNWTQEEADAFYDDKYGEIYADVEKKAQAEVDRLEAMRDRLNGLTDEEDE